jgi:hypothetical protein
MDNYRQQQESELREQTILAVFHAMLGQASDDELRLICWHSGIDFDKEVKRASDH